MINIKWFNGNSEGKYVLELMFEDGKKGYIKGDYQFVSNHYEVQWKYGEDVVGQVIFDPKWNVICHRYRSQFQKIA